MSKYKLTYFHLAGNRGEEVRLALTIAGQAFDDVRIDHSVFKDMKPDLPFGSLPMLEIEGHGTLAQSNAILRLIGSQHDLHPKDPYEAARHDSLMDAVEDLRHRLSATMRIEDPDTRKSARQQLSVTYIPLWATCVERMIADGPFIGGDNLHVADIKFFMVDRWLTAGILDDIPADIFDPYPKFKALSAAVKNHPAVVDWYAETA